MAGAGARVRARARRKETEPMDLHEAPRREDVCVARLRIVPVGNGTGAKRAARSGGTLQINCTVRPVSDDANSSHQEPREAPEVVYARPVWSAPVAPKRDPVREIEIHERMPRHERSRFADVPTAVIPAPRQNLADLQLRAAHALSGLQAGLQLLQTQGIDLRKWSKSSIAWTAAVAVYAVVLFLIAILTS